MLAVLSVLLGLLTVHSNARISGDYSCAAFNGTDTAYTPSAFACSNSISDAACAVLYPPTTPIDGYPFAGSDIERPLACYTTEIATPAAVVNDMKTAAIRNCPRTCGFCCLTDAYNCKNSPTPRLNCANLAPSQCTSPVWREIIVADCPATCGLCNVKSGGCSDILSDCSNDPGICRNAGMQDFVHKYCKKTCNFC